MSRERIALRAEHGFAAANAIVALAIGLGVFGGLPARWLWVDVPASLLIVLLLGSSGALVARAAIAARLLRIAGISLLALGLTAIFALTSSIAFLRGIYGAVGSDGVVFFSLTILFALPYVVVYPVVLLVWTRREPK